MSEQVQAEKFNIGKLFVPAVVLAVIGLVLSGIQYSQGTESFYQSYIFGWTFWICVTLGCLGISLLHHMVRGSWGLSVLRLYESGGGPTMLILMLALFIPVLLPSGMHSLYHHWMEPNGDLVLLQKQWFLNPTTFMVATGAYFLIWLFFSWYNRSSSLRQDRTADPHETAKRTNWSVAGVIIFVITVTFSQTHWTMSLQPHFVSTIWGVWFIAGMALCALSLGTIVVCFNAKKAPYNEIVSPNLTKDLGNMMFVFTMFWCYTTFSQFIIIWSGNINETTSYFISRTEHGWAQYGFFLMSCGFFVPWMMLLSPRLKANADRLKWVAVIIIVMRVADVYYLIMPFFRQTPMPAIGDLGALLLIGGVWLAAFSILARQQSLLPAYDQRLQEALAHEH